MAVNGGSVPDVLDRTLACIAAQQGFNKPRFNVQSGSGARDGYTSTIYRATISDEDSSTRHDDIAVMCKIAMPLFGDFMSLICAGESFMYRKVLPVLEDILGDKVPLPWPRCYYALMEGPAPHCLVLGDLRPSGYAMAVRRDTLDEAHCRLALAQLARFHGAGLALQHLRPKEANALNTDLGDPFESTGMQDLLEPFIHTIQGSGLLETLKDKFQDGSDVYGRVKKLLNAFEKNVVSIMCPKDGAGYTFTHGDCHANNMLFQYDKVTGAVTDCKLIDFQLTRTACPALDLSTLLMAGTLKEMRDAHWQTLLRGYHQGLQRTLRAAGIGEPDAVYSWELFQAQMASASWYGLCMSSLLYNAMSADDEMVSQMREALASEGDDKPSPPFKLTPEIVKHLGDLVQDLLDWGWLPSDADIDRRLSEHDSKRK